MEGHVAPYPYARIQRLRGTDLWRDAVAVHERRDAQPERRAQAGRRRRQTMTDCAGLQAELMAGRCGRTGRDGASSPGTGMGEGMHHQAPKRLRTRECARAPSVIGLRASSQPARSAATYTVGGSRRLRFSECFTGKRSSVPESFRGGCSFGGQQAGSLPLAMFVKLRRFAAEL
jgi:hypothetical protein